MQTLRQAIAGHILSGRGRETANRLGFLDCCYGRAELSWGDGEKTPIIFTRPTTKCRHCGGDVTEDEAKVQAAYWTPGCYQIWHKSCHEQYHHIEVIDQQMIDKDCNECKHFKATEPVNRAGNRHGICVITGDATIAYPGGVYCSYPAHEECFEHRKGN